MPREERFTITWLRFSGLVRHLQELVAEESAHLRLAEKRVGVGGRGKERSGELKIQSSDLLASPATSQ